MDNAIHKVLQADIAHCTLHIAHFSQLSTLKTNIKVDYQKIMCYHIIHHRLKGEPMLYRRYNEYIKQKYNARIKKICIDAGFTCPHRDGTCGVGGCIFCGERGAGDHIDITSHSIREHVERYLRYTRRVDGFIAYFQSFTNTYAPVDVLRERYDAALFDKRIVALAIATRPDCVSEDVAQLIQSYKSRVDVWAELGLQTSNDNTARLINRGYDTGAFENACNILKKYDIPIVVHIMIGLPGESDNELKNTVDYINHFDMQGIKIHNTYVMKNTRLEELYLNGEYTPITMDKYTDSVIYVLTHISPEIVIHRLTGDCPPDKLTAPDRNLRKEDIISEITRKMEERKVFQGCYYTKK